MEKNGKEKSNFLKKDTNHFILILHFGNVDFFKAFENMNRQYYIEK